MGIYLDKVRGLDHQPLSSLAHPIVDDSMQSLGYEINEVNEIRGVTSASCACSPMTGPAYVSTNYPPCPRCQLTTSCCQCGGCRSCRGEADWLDIDQAAVDARRRGSVERLLTRLRKGHEWLSETQAKLLEEVEVYEGMQGQFNNALGGWDDLDGMLREVYSYEGCVMGPGQRCPNESPVSCRGCASGEVEPMQEDGANHA